MANVSFHQLTATSVVTKVISQLQVPQSQFQSWTGMGLGGSNVTRVSGHHAGYDIFNNTRKIAQGRAPGTGPGTRALQPIGHVPIMLYRAHEKKHLLEERIFNTRALGNSWGTVDTRGQQYVLRQEKDLAQLFKNNREFMISRMFRGGFDLKQSGDDWIPVDVGSGQFTIDYQVPAGNKSKLNMTDINGTSITGGDILAASWATAGTDIIGHCLSINKCFQIQHGRGLAHCWVNSTVFGYLNANTGLKNAGGTANTVWASYERSGFTGPDGIKDTGFVVVFKGLPWLTFHVYDAVLEVDGTTTAFLDDTHAIFTPEMGDWCEGYEGSEIVAENVMDPGSERFGFNAWVERTTQPAGWDMIAVDNFLPVLYIPRCVAYGLIVY